PLASSQFGGGPPTQAPAEQVSAVVQAFPSLQGLVLLVCTHPVAVLHVSVVQTLPSSQFGGGPPTQAPAEQVSPVVQAFPSLQGDVLLVCTHPVAGFHATVVEAAPSAEVGGAATHGASAASVHAGVAATPP